MKEKVEKIIGKQKLEIEKMLKNNLMDKPKITYMNCFLYRSPILYEEGEVEQPKGNSKKISLFIQENKPMFAKIYPNNPTNPYYYTKVRGVPSQQKRRAIDFKIKINDYFVPPTKRTDIVFSYDPKQLPPILDCDNECFRIQRNMRLAQALNINVEKHELPAYSRDIVKFAKKNLEFVEWVEQVFQDFITAPTDNYYFT